MEQLMPQIGDAVDLAAVAATLRCSAADLDAAAVVSTGLRDVMVGFRSLEVLTALRPDMAAVSALSEQLDVVGIHCFVLFGIGEESAAEAAGATATATGFVRNFAPLFEIDEESATGTSNCALASWLFASGRLVQQRYSFEQGDTMEPPSPSRIHVQLAGGEGGGALSAPPRVGGRARFAKAGTVALPPPATAAAASATPSAL